MYVAGAGISLVPLALQSDELPTVLHILATLRRRKFAHKQNDLSFSHEASSNILSGENINIWILVLLFTFMKDMGLVFQI